MTAKYRPDIDGLRAIAVLAVLLFHGFPELLPGGFVGVDVFFVISGFLITTILWTDLDGKKFSYRTFYARRIRRIFPSLIGVLILSLFSGFFLLDVESFQKLGWHVFGGSLFISNFILLKEVGYFDISSAFKPLLHLWSLGVEEQYYLIWPPLIVLIHRLKRRSLPVLILLIGVSFACSLYSMNTWTAFDFYSPLTRAWELFLGGVLALKPLNKKSRMASAQAAIGLTLLVLSFFFIHEGKNFPGYLALGPTLATFLLLRAGPESPINKKFLSLSPLVAIGLISYPLYLIHWPALVFVRAAYGAPPPGSIKLVTLLATFILAMGFYKFIEMPIRFGKFKFSVVGPLVGALLAVAGLGVASSTIGALQNPIMVEMGQEFRKAMAWPYWEDPRCLVRYRMSPCQSTGPNPNIVILGDSHGNHLFPGLAKRKNDRVLAAGTCPPLDKVRLLVEKNQNEHPCAFNDYLSANFRVIEAEKSAKTVILATYWTEALKDFTPEYPGEKWGGMRLHALLPNEKNLPSEEIVWRGLNRTLQHLRKLGVRIIFVRDVFSFNGYILEFCGLASPDCTVDKKQILADRAPEDRLVERLKQEAPDVLIFDPLPNFCDNLKCYFKKNGRYYFRDGHHLSELGSDLMAEGLAPFLN